MEAIATCIEGLEEIAQLEIKEILKQKSTIVIPSRIKFNFKEDKDLANFTYNTRSIIKAYKLIESFQFKDLEELLDKVKKIKFPKIKSPFVVRCERIGNHNFNSIDIEKEVGDILNKNNKLKVDLKNPTTIVLIDIVNDNCFIGIDFTDIKLSKRYYRIRLSSNSLNSCLAYSLVRISGLKEKEILLDPFCKSGEITIEAVLYLLNIPPQQKNPDKLAFTKLLNYKPKNKIKNKKLNIYAIDPSNNNLKSVEINSKIAGINKNIKFARYDIEWLDTKFKKNTIDKIITFPQYPTNNFPVKEVEKIYKELFYQAEFILKPKATITILTPIPELIEKYASLNKFKKLKEVKIKYINQSYSILLFQKAFKDNNKP